MNKFILFLFIITGLCTTSCIEIIDDLTLNNDGSGTFKYTINLSSSKLKVNAILALDSLNGQRIPKINEIKEKFKQFQQTLSTQPGISNVTISENYTDFIFKFQCDFTTLSTLQDGLKQAFLIFYSEKDENTWIEWNGKTLTRSVPKLSFPEFFVLSSKEEELLKQGYYMSITRFDTPITKFSNTNSILSKSKLALMLKVNSFDLKQNINLIENQITINKTK
jgi:hypothetical protein